MCIRNLHSQSAFTICTRTRVVTPTEHILLSSIPRCQHDYIQFSNPPVLFIECLVPFCVPQLHPRKPSSRFSLSAAEQWPDMFSSASISSLAFATRRSRPRSYTRGRSRHLRCSFPTIPIFPITNTQRRIVMSTLQPCRDSDPGPTHSQIAGSPMLRLSSLIFLFPLWTLVAGLSLVSTNQND
ncbi:hypothetical protein F5Y18DRAFT_319433 [Xylariaceae sp. FL1019]|nr:hypothetical protein F5Y18DRAFT_319433 [Xylariaceae sp. FL1019]